MLLFLFSNSIKVFYGSGDCLVLNIPTSDSDDIPEIVRRLEEISIGCQVKQIFLPGFLELLMLHACIHMTKCQSKFLKSKFSKAFTWTKLCFLVNWLIIDQFSGNEIPFFYEKYVDMCSAFVDIEELGVAHFYFRASCFDTVNARTFTYLGNRLLIPSII